MAAFGGLFALGLRPLHLLRGGSSDAGLVVSAGCSCLPLCVIWPVISSSLSLLLLPMTKFVPRVLPMCGVLPNAYGALAATLCKYQPDQLCLKLSTEQSSKYDIAWPWLSLHISTTCYIGSHRMHALSLLTWSTPSNACTHNYCLAW